MVESDRDTVFSELERLASLVRERNQIEEGITGIVGRPAQIGHFGEYLASVIFGINLEESATNPGYDGKFVDEPLAGKTVNVKMYGKREGILDMNEAHVPDYYLVLSGPKTAALSSKGVSRPWVISEVFLFDALSLVSRSRARGVKIGVATSVISAEWERARVFPSSPSSPLVLSPDQDRLLSLFSP
jgi:hypothetical protein